MSIVFGIDHGNNHVKAISSFTEKPLLYPSYFSRPSDLGDVEEDLLNPQNAYNLHRFISHTYKDEVYVWGEDIGKAKQFMTTNGKEGRYKQKPYLLLSEFIMAHLVKGADTNLFPNVTVVTGCPTREKGHAVEGDLIKAFEGAHVVSIDGEDKILTVKDVFVMPQPLGTILDLYLDDEGYVADESYEKKYVGVIDIGGGTVDIDGVKGLKRQKDDMDTFGPGVIDTYQRIANFIVEADPYSGATRSKVEQQLAAGSEGYKISERSTIDIKEIKERVFRELAENLVNQVQSRWSTFTRFDEILLTGGGAAIPHIAEAFRTLDKDITIIRDSQFANAKGFYKYGLSKTHEGN